MGQLPITQQITSIKHEIVVEARELNTAAGRRRLRKFLLEGEKIIGWALSAGVEVEHVFFDSKIQEHLFLDELVSRNVATLGVSDGILKKISDTTYLIPFIGVARLSQSDNPLGDFVIVLDDVRDQGNIGSPLFGPRMFLDQGCIDWPPKSRAHQVMKDEYYCGCNRTGQESGAGYEQSLCHNRCRIDGHVVPPDGGPVHEGTREKHGNPQR